MDLIESIAVQYFQLEELLEGLLPSNRRYMEPYLSGVSAQK